MAPDLIGNAAAWALAGVFAAAVVHKLGDYLAFRGILDQYRILPSGLVPLAAPLVILLEGAACLALAVPPWRLLGAWLAGGLLLTYMAAMGLNLYVRRRTAVDCGCGAAPTPLSGWLLLRNALLLGLVPCAALPAAVDAMACALAAVVAVFLWLAYGAGNQLLANQGNAALAEMAGVGLRHRLGATPADSIVRFPRHQETAGETGTAHA